MGSQGSVGNRVREQIRAERERRDWTQRQLSDALKQQGYTSMHPSTIAKIEAGDRAVMIDELDAFATLFGVSVDVLLGRDPSGTDVAWSVSKLSSNARKAAIEIAAIQQRLDSDFREVVFYARRDRKALGWLGEAMAAINDCLAKAQRNLRQIDFPANPVR